MTSVKRCPSCGRAWDQVLCFACGYAEKSALSSTPPGPSPSQAQPPRPAFAPLPPLPTLPNQPVLGREEPARPATPLVPPSAQFGFQGARTEQPIAQPQIVQPQIAQSQIVQPQIVQPQIVQPQIVQPQIQQVSTPPQPAAVEPEVRVQPKPMAQAKATPAQRVTTEARPALAQNPVAQNPALIEATDTRVSVERQRPRFVQFVNSQMVYPAAFVGGFVVTFALTALIAWKSPDLKAMLANGDPHSVVQILEEKEKAGAVKKDEWVLYGHALHAGYGTYRRAEMLAKYSVAVQSKAVDQQALYNTLEALVDKTVRRDAIGVLRLSWPEEFDVNARIKERLDDENIEMRHAAIDALSARNADDESLKNARARVAVVDARTRICDVTRPALDEMKKLADEGAFEILKSQGAIDLLIDLQSEFAFTDQCMKKPEIASVLTRIAGQNAKPPAPKGTKKQ